MWTQEEHSEASAETVYQRGISSDRLWQFKAYCHIGTSSGSYRNVELNSSRDFVYDSVSFILDCGKRFYAVPKADAVKVFVCPSGGTVCLQTVFSESEDTSDAPKGGSEQFTFAVYVESQQVYPADGASHALLTVDSVMSLDLELKVRKNQRIYIHVGVKDGTFTSVEMENKVIYRTVNEEEAYYAMRCSHSFDARIPLSQGNEGCRTSSEFLVCCKNCPYRAKGSSSFVKHDYGPYVVENSAASSECGTMSRVCDQCNDTETVYSSKAHLVDSATGISVCVFDTNLNYDVTLTAKDGGYYLDYSRMDLFNGFFQVNLPLGENGAMPTAVRFIGPDGWEQVLTPELYFGSASVTVFCPGLLIPVYGD